MDEPVVDAAHGQHADRTAGAVDQLDVGRQQILQAEAIDGVSVAAAHFHEAVVPPRDRPAGGSPRRSCVISSGSRNSSTNFMVSSSTSAVALALPPWRLRFSPSMRQHAASVERVLFADLAHGEADVDQHPVARLAADRPPAARYRPAAHARPLPPARDSRSSGNSSTIFPGMARHIAFLYNSPCLRATISNEHFSSSFSFSVPPATDDRLDAVVALQKGELADARASISPSDRNLRRNRG